ncbi:hypothetical protein [Taibaiella koreensis]|uniref:hypothetical protein n=1 Tax=Taibaiella koreensis TaxID=1268548 RepID=UPI000E59C22C|nr:hypothetical protein [Taibaiella koreensis]
MTKEKMRTDEHARLHLEALPFAALYWSVQPQQLMVKEWLPSRRYHTREYIYKRYYKLISRRDGR